MTPTLEYSNFHRRNHLVDIDRAFTLRAPTREKDRFGGYVARHVAVRVRVHHDTAYPKQSWAHAEVWNPDVMAWHEVASVLWQAWADDTGLLSGEMTGGAFAASDELEARARATLGAIQ